MRLVTQPIRKRESFKYIVSIIQSSRDIDNDVTHKFYGMIVRLSAIWRGVLASQKFACSKDAGCKDKDIKMDV